jgi:hypothetical protein
VGTMGISDEDKKGFVIDTCLLVLNSYNVFSLLMMQLNKLECLSISCLWTAYQIFCTKTIRSNDMVP